MAVQNNSKELQVEIDKYRKVMEENPDSRMFAALADSLRRAGDIKAAISVAEDGLARHPKYMSGMVVLAQAFLADGQLEKAQQLFVNVVRMNPENIVAQRSLAEIYDRLGDHNNALRTYGILTILDPGDTKARERVQILEATAPKSVKPVERKPASPPPVPPVSETGSISADNESSARGDEVKSDGMAPPPFEIPGEEFSEVPSSSAGEALTAADAAPASDGYEDEGSSSGVIESGDVLSDESMDLPPPPLDEKSLERKQGLDQFFEGSGEVGKPSMPLPGSLKSPAVKLPPPTRSTAAEEAENSISEIPASPHSPVPTLSEEEKLDLFFSGADLTQLCENADGFTVKPAGEAIEDQPLKPGSDLTPVPQLVITSSKLGGIFWGQGFFEKALMVMASELINNNEDKELRKEFILACQSLGRVPEEVLREQICNPPNFAPAAKNVEPSESGAAVESTPAPDSSVPEPRAVPEPTPSDEQSESVTEVAPVAAADESSVGSRSGSGSLDGDRINVLRSYLNRIRKDKEQKR